MSTDIENRLPPVYIHKLLHNNDLKGMTPPVPTSVTVAREVRSVFVTPAAATLPVARDTLRPSAWAADANEHPVAGAIRFRKDGA